MRTLFAISGLCCGILLLSSCDLDLSGLEFGSSECKYTLVGRITKSGGGGVKNVNVWFQSEQGNTLGRSDQTDGKGRYTLEYYPKNVYFPNRPHQVNFSKDGIIRSKSAPTFNCGDERTLNLVWRQD